MLWCLKSEWRLSSAYFPHGRSGPSTSATKLHEDISTLESKFISCVLLIASNRNHLGVSEKMYPKIDSLSSHVPLKLPCWSKPHFHGQPLTFLGMQLNHGYQPHRLRYNPYGPIGPIAIVVDPLMTGIALPSCLPSCLPMQDTAPPPFMGLCLRSGSEYQQPQHSEHTNGFVWKWWENPIPSTGKENMFPIGSH